MIKRRYGTLSGIECKLWFGENYDQVKFFLQRWRCGKKEYGEIGKNLSSGCVHKYELK